MIPQQLQKTLTQMFALYSQTVCILHSFQHRVGDEALILGGEDSGPVSERNTPSFLPAKRLLQLCNIFVSTLITRSSSCQLGIRRNRTKITLLLVHVSRAVEAGKNRGNLESAPALKSMTSFSNFNRCYMEILQTPTPNP